MSVALAAARTRRRGHAAGAPRDALRPRLAGADPQRGHLAGDGRQGPTRRRRDRRLGHRLRATRVLLRAGRGFRGRLARRGPRRDDRAGARARRPRPGSSRRFRLLGRRADAGGDRGARRLRADLPANGRVVGQGAADLGCHRSLGRGRRVLAGAHRLGRDDARVQHVPDRPRRRARSARRGRQRRAAGRDTCPRAKRRVSFRRRR